MQTFLPYPDYMASAKCLDNRRLGKQRVEVLQILNALTNPDAKGWKNHPCTQMWRGHEASLVKYGVAVCDEWIGRGFRDTVRDKLLNRGLDSDGATHPGWLGDERLHTSHRANLLRKDPEFYGRYGWDDDPETESFWPTRV